MEKSSIYSTWCAVGVSFTLWSLSYLAIHKALPQRSPEFCSRILSLVHGLLMAFYGLEQCFTGKPPFENPQEPTTSNQAFIMVVSLGYFMEDTIWCLYYQTETALMICHHTYSCFALMRMIFGGIGGHQVTCSLGGLEVTNPLLQARWFTRTFGYHETAIFSSIEITFIIMFFVVRIVIGSVILMFVVLQPKNSWEFVFLAVLIYTMSWMFMINICKYINNKYLQENVEEELSHIKTS